MNLPATPFARLTFFDLVDRVARYTGRVFRRSFIIGVATMLPAGAVLGFAMREIFAALADTIHRSALLPEPTLSSVLPMFYGAVEFGVALVVFIIGTIILDAAVIDLVDSEMHSEERTWQEAFSHAWHVAFRILAQKFVLFTLACTFSLFAMIAGALLVSLWPLVLLMCGAAAFWFLWLFISWSFGPQAVVCEGDGAVRGLVRSRMLVRGTWWRVFGIMFLFFVFSQVSVMILTSPLQGMALSSIFPDLLSSEKNMLMNGGDSATAEAMLVQLSNVGWQIGMLQAISALFTGMLSAVYGTVLYYDLRARQGEFDNVASEEAV